MLIENTNLIGEDDEWGRSFPYEKGRKKRSGSRIEPCEKFLSTKNSHRLKQG